MRLLNILLRTGGRVFAPTKFPSFSHGVAIIFSNAGTTLTVGVNLGVKRVVFDN